MAKPRIYATDAVWLNLARGRFTLSVEIISSAGWAATVEDEGLVAEIVRLGHIRLHRQTDIQAKRSEQNSGVEGNFSNWNDQSTRHQVDADRYHDIKFSRADKNRVVLRPEIVMAIVGDRYPEPRVRLFVQAGVLTVDVMTNSVRMSRLDEYSD